MKKVYLVLISGKWIAADSKIAVRVKAVNAGACTHKRYTQALSIRLETNHEYLCSAHCTLHSDLNFKRAYAQFSIYI